MKYSKRQKLSLLAISAAVGAIFYAASYCAKEASMTKWQREQPINIDNGTGSTKFKAHIDSIVLGGLAFCICAIALAARKKFKDKK